MPVKMEYRSKNQLVEERIREAIIKGELRPGERLIQDELAKRLGTSPTPVREALRRLEVHGLVVHEPNKGVRVVEINESDIEEIYLIRATLEALATEKAVPRLGPAELERLSELHQRYKEVLATGDKEELRRINHDFHFTIYEASGLGRLVQLIASLWSQFPWEALITVVDGRDRRSLDEHEAMLKAIQAGDAQAAARAAQAHIHSSGKTVLKHLSTGFELP